MDDFWIPRSANEVESAIGSGAVTESHYLDFKAFAESGRVPSTAAKCVASLAVDGGVLVLGVEEDKRARRFAPKPVALKGLRDAVDQSLANRVAPSLRATINELDCGDGTGYLAVVVPASARAPHMVDGRYYGRTDTGVTQLPDVDVRRLWQRHLDRQQQRSLLLADEVRREPVPEPLRSVGRLFVVAQPVSADPRLLLDACANRDLFSWILSAQALRSFQQVRNYGPHFGTAADPHRRARGVARSSWHFGSDRELTDEASSPHKALDLEIWEDGGLRLYYGRASEVAREERYLMLEAIVGEVSGVIQLARDVSEVAQFRGSWQFGVALRGIKSMRAYLPEGVSSGSNYSEDAYDETSEVDQSELCSSESPVLSELLGRLVRTVAPKVDIRTLDVFPIQ